MIKAEVISHEGNAGPNWLDHCRNLINPVNAALFVIFAAALVTVIGISVKDESVVTTNKQPASKDSQQFNIAPAQSLQVAPLSKTTTPAEQQSTSNLQSAGAPASTSSPTQAPAASSSSLGSSPTAQPQATPTNTKINGLLQSTRTDVKSGIDSLQQSLQDTRSTLKNTLQN